MTQKTVSNHWRKVLRIRLLSYQVHPTMLQYLTQHTCTAIWQDNHTQKHKHKHKWIKTQWNGSSETKPNPENCKNCSSKCAYDCAQLQYTIQHRTVLLTISSLTSRQHHVAWMLSIGGEGGTTSSVIGFTIINTFKQSNLQIQAGDATFIWKLIL